MKIKLLFLLLLFAGTIYSQNHTCGTSGETLDMIVETLKQHKRSAGEVNFREVRYVPLTFHVVSHTNGTGGVNLRNILEEVCNLNEGFAGTELQFFLDEIRYLPNTPVFEDPTNGDFLMDINRDNDAANIYVTLNANSGQGVGLTLGYYSGHNDWIVVKKDQVGFYNRTLPHEFGHFFSLPHTFNGWEPEPYDESIHGDTVTQVIAPNGNTAVEVMNDPQCEFTGDFICDTRPDYNFGFGWPDCNFTDSVWDRDEVLIDPMENNYMSYFLGCTGGEFTPDQITIMNEDLSSASRNYLRQQGTPNTTPVSQIPQLQYPLDVTTQYYDEVTLEWEDVGADHYLIEMIDFPGSLNTPDIQKVVETSSFLLTDLEKNKLYQWRVTAFNSGNTCESKISSSALFKTGNISDINDISEVAQWDLYPIPAKDQLNLSFSLHHTVAGKWKIVNTLGKAVMHQNITLNSNNNTLTLDVSVLSPGTYVFILENKGNINTRKFVILR